jgi:hypothetical protein
MSCHDYAITALAYSPSGKQIAIGGNRGEVRLWDVLTQKRPLRLESHNSYVTVLSFCSSDHWIASGHADSTVQLWRLEEGKTGTWSRVSVIHSSLGSVTSISWNPCVPLEFAITSKDNSIRVWKVDVNDRSVDVCLVWGAGIGRLCALDTKFHDAVGLSKTNRDLLDQRATPQHNPKNILPLLHTQRHGSVKAMIVAGLSLLSNNNDR